MTNALLAMLQFSQFQMSARSLLVTLPAYFEDADCAYLVQSALCGQSALPPMQHQLANYLLTLANTLSSNDYMSAADDTSLEVLLSMRHHGYLLFGFDDLLDKSLYREDVLNNPTDFGRLLSEDDQLLPGRVILALNFVREMKLLEVRPTILHKVTMFKCDETATIMSNYGVWIQRRGNEDCRTNSLEHKILHVMRRYSHEYGVFPDGRAPLSKDVEGMLLESDGLVCLRHVGSTEYTRTSVVLPTDPEHYPLIAIRALDWYGLRPSQVSVQVRTRSTFAGQLFDSLLGRPLKIERRLIDLLENQSE